MRPSSVACGFFCFAGGRGVGFCRATMGRVYMFTCPHCEYRAHVSGGQEEGFHCVTRTIKCCECRTLHDVTVRVRVAEAEAAPAAKPELLPARNNLLPPMLLFGSPRRTRWVELKLCCPVAAAHRIEVWVAPGKCPRCGTFLEREVLPYRIWD